MTERELGASAQPTRIAPVPEAEWTDEVRTLLTTAGGGTISRLNIHTTTSVYPGLMRHWLAYGGKLLIGSKLPVRVRELAILRVSWRCQAPYEWGQHVRIAHDIGVTALEVDQVTQGADAAGWSEFDAAVLRAVDELHDSATLTDPTWNTLAGQFTDAQMIELIMLIGMYQSTAYFLNAVGVPLDDDIGGLESR